MSTINQLSNDYQGVAALAEYFNKAVMVLKKEYLFADEFNRVKYPSLRLTDDERQAAHKFCEEVLTYLSAQPYFVQSVTTKIAKEDLAKLQKVLANKRVLTEEELEKLDIVLFFLDEERSVLFRKLRMSRI